MAMGQPRFFFCALDQGSGLRFRAEKTSSKTPRFLVNRLSLKYQVRYAQNGSATVTWWVLYQPTRIPNVIHTLDSRNSPVGDSLTAIPHYLYRHISVLLRSPTYMIR